MTHKKAVLALERYLSYRVTRRLRPGRYRRLDPTSKLILTHKGYKFHLNTKRRVSWAGRLITWRATA